MRVTKAIVVGSGAGGATAARRLALNGFEVSMYDAGRAFAPLTRKVSWLSPLRGTKILGDIDALNRIFPHYYVAKADPELTILSGVTEGGSTSISCGNMVRAENGLREIGLDLTPEFEEIERELTVNPIPRERWRPLTARMFDAAEELGHSPHPTPKATDLDKCVGCGYCEVGCATGAKWNSRRLYAQLLGEGVKLSLNSRVEKVVVEGNRARGVVVSRGEANGEVYADLVVLSAGGVGTAQILRASGLPARDNLWIDVVLTVGGVLKGSRMLNEPPMVWYVKKKNYILSPYLDLLSYWFHKPWRGVPLRNRVGMMIKLADSEQGTVFPDGRVAKSLTEIDWQRLTEAKTDAERIMDRAGVAGPFVEGMLHGGHLGGTVSLARDDVKTMHPSWLPENLWVADLSLLPKSQGLPTMLTTAALALRVTKCIVDGT